MKEELLRDLNSLKLPDNPLDELINELGGGAKAADLGPYGPRPCGPRPHAP